MNLTHDRPNVCFLWKLQCKT